MLAKGVIGIILVIGSGYESRRCNITLLSVSPSIARMAPALCHVVGEIMELLVIVTERL